MLWNAAVVLTIIVAFGGVLFALATDLPRRRSDRAWLGKELKSVVAPLAKYCGTDPATGHVGQGTY
jgi:hypothetical protein